MVTIASINKFNNVIELYGLSTDIKPIKNLQFNNSNYLIRNGSTYYEMDTKKVFIYDEENQKWLEM